MSVDTSVNFAVFAVDVGVGVSVDVGLPMYQAAVDANVDAGVDANADVDAIFFDVDVVDMDEEVDALADVGDC